MSQARQNTVSKLYSMINGYLDVGKDDFLFVIKDGNLVCKVSLETWNMGTGGAKLNRRIFTTIRLTDTLINFFIERAN